MFYIWIFSVITNRAGNKQGETTSSHSNKLKADHTELALAGNEKLPVCVQDNQQAHKTPHTAYVSMHEIPAVYLHTVRAQSPHQSPSKHTIDQIQYSMFLISAVYTDQTATSGSDK